jgi:hypothetical protein
MAPGSPEWNQPLPDFPAELGNVGTARCSGQVIGLFEFEMARNPSCRPRVAVKEQ